MRVFNNFLELSWAQRFTMILLAAAFVQNLRASFLKLIKGEWRFIYLYGAFTTGAIILYAALLLTEAIEPGEYARAVQWLSPLLVLRLIMAPSIHIWEESAIRSRERSGVVTTSHRNSKHISLYNRFRMVFHKGEGKGGGQSGVGTSGTGGQRNAIETSDFTK